MVKGSEFPNKSQIMRIRLSKNGRVRAIKGRELCTRASCRIVIRDYLDSIRVFMAKNVNHIIERLTIS